MHKVNIPQNYKFIQKDATAGICNFVLHFFHLWHFGGWFFSASHRLWSQLHTSLSQSVGGIYSHKLVGNSFIIFHYSSLFFQILTENLNIVFSEPTLRWQWWYWPMWYQCKNECREDFRSVTTLYPNYYSQNQHIYFSQVRLWLWSPPPYPLISGATQSSP